MHGDVSSFTAILQRAGLVDESGRWAGGITVLVQLGDLLDRRPDAKQVMTLAMSLESAAPRTGGRAIFLIGNHEAMNAMGELRDVVAATYATFVDAESQSRRQTAWSIHRALAERRRKELADADRSLTVPDVFAETTEQAWMAAHPPGMLEYLEAFGASGVYGRWIRGHDTIVRVGTSAFQHAGLDSTKRASKLEDVNSRVRDDLKRWDEGRAIWSATISRPHRLRSGRFSRQDRSNWPAWLRFAASARAAATRRSWTSFVQSTTRRS